MQVVAVGREGAREDVVVEAPDDVSIEVARSGGSLEPDALRRRRSTSAGSPQRRSNALIAGLEAAGFDVVADTSLTPPEPRRKVRREEPSTKLRVSVGAAESALALVEAEGGVYVWVRPDEMPASEAVRRSAPGVVTFTLFVPERDRAARRDTKGLGIGWLVDVLSRPVRILILRFAVRLTVDAIMNRIEGGNATGLVTIAGLDPETWKPGRVALRAQDEGRPVRVLLLLHGTFSNTAGSFGHLAKHPDGRAFLEGALAAYDVVLGFDHKTLAADVETNAEDLADALASLPDGSLVDCVAYSRGGLVYRVLADELVPTRRPDIRFGKAIFVGCANSGTHLAHPRNWEALVDLYTNAIMAGARVASFLASGGALDPFVKLGIKTLGEFVQLLPQVAVSERRVPGLASMHPDGPTVARLNALTSTNDAAYFAVTSDFEPGADGSMGMSQRLREFLLDRVTDDLWQKQANDLVVDTASMSSFGPRRHALPTASTHSFGKTGLVYHTVYFASPDTCRRLSNWLELPQAGPGEHWHEPIDRRRSSNLELLDGDDEVRSHKRIPRGPSDTDAASGGTSSSADGGKRSRARRGGRVPTDAIHPPKVDTAGTPSTAPADEAPVDLTVSAQAPESAIVGQVVDVEVTLSREALDTVAGPHVGQTRIPADARRKVRVRVTARTTNCKLVDSGEETTPMPAAGAPVALVFRLEGLAAGPAEVWVDVYQGALRLARIVLQPTFTASAMLAATAAVRSAEADKPLVNLRIFEEPTGGGHWRLRFIASSEELGIESEFVTQEIRVNKNEYISDLYSKLEDAWSSTEGNFVPFSIQMQARGVELYRGLFPRELQEIIWSRKDEIGSVQVFSYEPSIPWEVAFVAEVGKVASSKGVFLSELGLTRWISNVGVAPARLRLRPGKARYCIPDYLDASYHLPSVAEEARMLRQKLGATEIVPHLEPVISALGRKEDQDYDLLHFACHGSGEAEKIWNAGLMLAGIKRNGRVAREELSPADIKAFADLARDGQKPIVFLNACQTGVGGDTLTGSGGLAQAFVERGAGVFVGTLWSVGDTTALSFCETFYDALQDGRSLSQAVRAARERAKRENEATWLAYTVYGHPYARVQVA